METSRPLDALNKSRDKRVIVELKNTKQYIGNLKAFDIHINVVLEDAEEYIYETPEKDKRVMNRKLDVVFIRGDTITIISPQK
ncbi:small nuclear ribonucleoprotein [Candidatus Woesearchaeota archaeon]|nr:small nuclear ribonucleoprotein [Candidatus Woesearchaeota archaeon]